MLPKGLVLAEKLITKMEHVGHDDTITTEPMAVLIIPQGKPDTIQVYLKESCTLIMEYPILQLLQNLPPEELARIKVELLRQQKR